MTCRVLWVQGCDRSVIVRRSLRRNVGMLEGAGDGAAVAALVFPRFNRTKRSIIFIPLSRRCSFPYQM